MVCPVIGFMLLPQVAGLRRLEGLTKHSHSANIRRVNVISAATIRNFAAAHADAAEELMRWYKMASRSAWIDIHDVRRSFPDADQFNSLLIFNIRHNWYRLIVKVDYRAKLILVKEFLTHDRYMRGGWKKWAR
jgi:mRNA interferase HigB